jgi:hypothetical protein
MVLRCPRCSELRFFGRTQLLGELVVCPQCEAVFGWRDSALVDAPRDAAGAGETNGNGSDVKP